MKYARKLEELERAIFGCLHCNRCHYGQWPENNEICPIFSYDQCFAHSAGGMMYLAKALIKEQTTYSDHLADLVYTCSTCRGCDELCMLMRSVNPEMPLSDIIRLMRYELVKREMIPEKIKGLFSTVKNKGEIPANEAAALPKLPEEIRKDDADMVVYGDCAHTAGQKAGYAHLYNVLKKMGQSVSLFTTGGCCGSTLFDYGFWDELPALVSTKAARLRDYACKSFIYLNPHCQEFITRRYNMIAEDFEPPKSRHASELIAEALDRGRLIPANGTAIKVSYHDPCMLGRSLGITEPPRHVLRQLKGVELIEMKRNRQDTFCCGARAAGDYFADFSLQTARQRLAEFQDTGADIMITACPYCHDIFQKAFGEEKDRVKELVAFVDERTE